MKFALTPKTFCSACFTQAHNRHVDFDASSERGFGWDGTKQISMDDLILCELCIAEAARMVDFEPIGTSAQTISRLEAELDLVKKERTQAQNYADRLEEAFDGRPEPIHVNHRKKPRALRSNLEELELA